MVKLFFDEQIKIESETKELKPIDYLLLAVAHCIKSELVECLSEEQLKLLSISLYFGNKEIKIVCNCSNDLKADIIEVCGQCFILKNLKFNCNIIFKENI
jgi:hypothetical protein